MPYIGNPIYQSAFVTDTFSGTGAQTVYTMSVAPAGTTNVLVVVSGVVQDPATYGVVGNTLTFSAAPPSGTGNISCRYLGVPVTGVVTTAYRTLTEFTATAGQTTFTPPSYNVGFINVLRNGVQLGTADFTATNGITVVLATGATAGDLITVESFLISSVANAIPNAAGSVSSSNIVDGAVTPAKLSTGGPTWDTSGNFGVGASPTYGKEDVYQSGTTSRALTVYRGAQNVSGTVATTFGYPYLQIGGLEYNNTTGYNQTIGFGYTNGGANPPAEIGFVTTSSSGQTYGDLVFGTRAVTSNTAVTERMRIDSSGRVTMPYQPRFSAYLASNTTFNSAVVVFDTKWFDVGSNYNTSNGRFTAPIAGYYQFNVNIHTNGSNDHASQLRVNGTPRGGVYGASGTWLPVTFSQIVSLSAGDYVDVLSPYNQTVEGGSMWNSFSGGLLG